MITYGSQYYRPPYPTREDWGIDFHNMRQCGFNTIKLWAVWSWMERLPGEWFFDDLDNLLELCSQYDLKAVINLIPEGIPYWTARKYPDARYTTERNLVIDLSGAANLPSGGSPGLCADHPEVMALISNFISTVVKHFRNHPAIIAFDIWNEPHIEPVWDYPDSLFCYCEHSRNRWLEWLQEKYPNLDALNVAWNRAYSTWEDVLPPRRFGTYPDMIDWRTFWLHNLSFWLAERASAARLFAGQVPIMTHVPFSGYLGTSGDGGLGQLGGDEFLLVPHVDQFGLTSFPKWLMKNDFVQHLVNVELVASASGEKRFWQSELQPGISKWEAFGRTTATPDEIRLWNWSAISSGAKGLLYWQWRPEPSGLESPGFGLTNLDGSISDRTIAAAECVGFFNHLPGFSASRRIPEMNAILVSRTADLYFHAANQGEAFYAHAIYGAYRACFDAGIPVRIMHTDALISGNQVFPKVLYVPGAVALSDTELNFLQEFVDLGGCLVVEAGFGLYNELGLLRRDFSHFQTLFDTNRPEVEKTDDMVVHWNVENASLTQTQSFSGIHYRQYFHEVNTKAAILATFTDGKAAIIRSNMGKGTAIWIGTFPSTTLAVSYNLATAKAISRWMCPNGYHGMNKLSCPPGTLLRMFEHDQDHYLSTVNYTHDTKGVEIEFNSPVYCVGTSGEGKYQQRSPQSLNITIAARSGMLIHLQNHES